MRTRIGLLTFLMAGFILPGYAANPVSKGYVDELIQSLQAQISVINTNISSITSTISTISIAPTTDSALHVGDYYQGGVIFWLDASRSNMHGLIADIADKAGTYQWSLANTLTGAALNGAYQGKNSGSYNTAKILSTSGTSYPAAAACAGSVNQGYSDWYLPSMMELSALHGMRMTIGEVSFSHGGSGFDVNSYWSSTEGSSAQAWVLLFSTGTTNLDAKTTALKVRCIRAF